MVAGPFAVGKEDQKPSGTPTQSSKTTAGSAIISSTSYFDSVSPHFSRRQPPKINSTMPVPVASSQEGGPSPPSLSEGGSGDQGDAPPRSSSSRGYRHPPPPGYAHYPPYGYPGGPHYGGPPPHGYHPHHGQPPPGYPHHHPHAHPSSYSPPPGYPGGRPMYPGYGGGTPGSSAHGYPHQHPRDGRSKTPPFQRGPRPSSAGRPAASSQPRASPVGSRDGKNRKSSPEQGTQSQGTPGENGSSARASPTQVADEIETERLRQAALTEISPAQVEPIKTAFHFFVMDMRDSLRREAEAEVQKSLPPGQAMDSYLVNSNLNCRLMEAWENVSEDVRQNCMASEEADRRRFMEEEEIASRHCATLTARSKSPKTPERRSSSHNGGSAEQSSHRSSPAPSPTTSVTNAHGNSRTDMSGPARSSPATSPISRMVVGKSHSMDQDEKKMDDSVTSVHHHGDRDRRTFVKEERTTMVMRSSSRDQGEKASDALDGDPNNKRPSPTKVDAKHESPPKRNRADEPAEEKSAKEDTA